MRLVPLRIEVRSGDSVFTAAVGGNGPVAVGGLEIELSVGPSWPTVSWAVANRDDSALRLRAVSLVFGLTDVVEPVRMFRNGYQSWSPSGVATFGMDVDPTTRAHFEFLQACHHADQRVVPTPEELRSEWVTLLADASGAVMLAGFAAGTEHDGTLRLRSSGDAMIELFAEAFLGDVLVGSGEQRSLHGVVIDVGGDGLRGAELLDRWARVVGQAGRARVDAAYQVGWCSWYHYFNGITENSLATNLARIEGWPFEIVLLDDGYQSAIGDWLNTNEKFPAGLPTVAERIRTVGATPGIWLAPFLAAPDSRLVTEHPDWLARYMGADGATSVLCSWWNPVWGGGRDGFMYCLDTTKLEVIAHLESLARSLVDMGFTYLKLDFAFAPGVDGVWANPSLTPAQRVRTGFEAMRKGAGDSAFILGCGVPLSHVVGLVDSSRVGPDVAPLWALETSAEIIPGYLAAQPATRHAYSNTLARSFMHRRMWLNDPDCIMLRTEQTKLGSDAARTWSQAVGVSGGMVFVSDDLALLGADARVALDEVVAIGRASDDEARRGLPAIAADLMEEIPPTTFSAAGYTLVTDPVTGSSTLSSSPSPG